MNQPITMGSLFDGVGAFPLAASYFGIKTLWASEILPNAVSVTRRHFPDMEHLGDVTKLHGGKIPYVNIISFGSPCQSFSAAGNRSSFNGKSGMFFEAIRIIREMRSATNGKYPEIVCFENVVGLLSVDSRRSYKTVLEAFCETEIPMPESGRWANAGMVRGRGIDLAWIIKDSQHFRVPQRRKRLFIIADFTERRCAGEILFISQSLSGYFAAREREGQGASSNAQSGSGSTGGDITAAFMAGQAKNARSIAYSETLSPTLKGSPSGLNQMPCICEPQQPDKNSPVVYGICSQSSHSMQSDNAFSGIYVADTSRTLGQNCGNPSCNQGGMVVVEPQIARTLTARGDSSPCADRGQNIVTMRLNEGPPIYPEISGTLCASGAGLSRPAGMVSETDLCVVVPDSADLIRKRQLEPIPIHDKATWYKGGGATRRNDGAGNGFGIGKSGQPVPTMMAKDRHAIAAVDCRNLNDNYQNPVRTGYIIRRLTPTEAERLMSLPDGWTQYGHDGKLMSDSARYSMCGNSIVVNVLAYIMQNIAGALSRTENSQQGKP